MQNQDGSSKFLQNKVIIYELHRYLGYVVSFVYVLSYSYARALTQASEARSASPPVAMSYPAPAEYWLAYAPSAWGSGRTKTLTCLVCNKVIQWPPWHQNGLSATEGHRKQWKHLTCTSGIYFAIRKRCAELHPEAEPAADANNSSTPLPTNGWTEHFDKESNTKFITIEEPTLRSGIYGLVQRLMIYRLVQKLIPTQNRKRLQARQ